MAAKHGRTTQAASGIVDGRDKEGSEIAFIDMNCQLELLSLAVLDAVSAIHWNRCNLINGKCADLRDAFGLQIYVITALEAVLSSYFSYILVMECRILKDDLRNVKVAGGGALANFDLE